MTGANHTIVVALLGTNYLVVGTNQAVLTFDY